MTLTRWAKDPVIRAAAAAFGAAVLTVVLALSIYAPAWTRWHARRAELETLRIQQADAAFIAAQAAAQEAAWRQTREALRPYLVEMAGDQALLQLLEALRAEAASLDVTLSASHAAADVRAEGRRVTFGPALTVRETPVRVRLTGSYRAIGELLGRLAHRPELVELQRISMTPASEPAGALEAAVELGVYVAAGAPPS